MIFNSNRPMAVIIDLVLAVLLLRLLMWIDTLAQAPHF